LVHCIPIRYELTFRVIEGFIVAYITPIEQLFGLNHWAIVRTKSFRKLLFDINDDVCFVPDQHSELELKQQPKRQTCQSDGTHYPDSVSTIYILSMKYTLYRYANQLDLNTNGMLSRNLIRISLLFQTDLTTPLSIEVPVSSQERGYVC
jgi:hypothetical protein